MNKLELLRQLVAISAPARGGNVARNAPAQAPTTYRDFVATHPPLFTEAREPLEANNWLRVIETKFTMQQLRGDASAWWAKYTVACPTNYQVPWEEFREAFRAHHILVSIMRRKHQEFMDLKQGGWSVHEYSKLFNHLVQYASEQVDTDGKKKDRFMNGLLTKLQERLALITGGTFPKFVSNAIIADDVIRTQKESKKRKVVVAASSSAPLKYWVVYHPPRSTTSRVSINTSSGLPTHLSIHTNMQHQRLYLHHHLCCACLSHRPLEPPLAISASIVVVPATSLESAPL
jgi:hypothetical protein